MSSTRPWNCRRVREQLSDYIQGYLSEAEGDTVKQHLCGCAACRQAVDLERRLVGIKETHMLCSVPDDFAASVLEVRRRQHPVGAFKRTFVFRWTACTGFAFRTCVDPLLWTEYRLQGILASVLSAMAAPLAVVRAGLLTEALVIYRQIAIPLQMAYKQVCGSLANKVYHF